MQRSSGSVVESLEPDTTVFEVAAESEPADSTRQAVVSEAEVSPPTASSLGEGEPLDGITVVGVHESEAVLWLADNSSQSAVADDEVVSAEAALERDPSEGNRLQGVLSRWLSLPGSDSDAADTASAAGDEVSVAEPEVVAVEDAVAVEDLTAAAVTLESDVVEAQFTPNEDDVVAESEGEDAGLLATLSSWLKPASDDAAEATPAEAVEPFVEEPVDTAELVTAETALDEPDVVDADASSTTVLDIAGFDVEPETEAIEALETELSAPDATVVEAAVEQPVEPAEDEQTSKLLSTLAAWLKPEPGDTAVADELVIFDAETVAETAADEVGASDTETEPDVRGRRGAGGDERRVRLHRCCGCWRGRRRRCR